jgi:ribulose-phosphate 3-epimerase
VAPLVAPSLLASDFARLGEQIGILAAAGCQVLHVDVMDGHFVPNLSMGPPVVKSIRACTALALDVHIMVTDPAYYIERFAEAGADSITFHVEATSEPGRLIARLHELGLGAGICLRPGTPAEAIAQVAREVDMVLVMTVEPGYGGQDFMADMLDKVEAVRGMLDAGRRLEVDGGIDRHTCRLCAERGADVFVAGSHILGRRDIASAFVAMRQAVAGRAARPAENQ